MIAIALVGFAWAVSVVYGLEALKKDARVPQLHYRTPREVRALSIGLAGLGALVIAWYVSGSAAFLFLTWWVLACAQQVLYDVCARRGGTGGIQ